jgi:hypothetical protein
MERFGVAKFSGGQRGRMGHLEIMQQNFLQGHVLPGLSVPNSGCREIRSCHRSTGRQNAKRPPGGSRYVRT